MITSSSRERRGERRHPIASDIGRSSDGDLLSDVGNAGQQDDARIGNPRALPELDLFERRHAAQDLQTPVRNLVCPHNSASGGTSRRCVRSRHRLYRGSTCRSSSSSWCSDRRGESHRPARPSARATREPEIAASRGAKHHPRTGNSRRALAAPASPRAPETTTTQIRALAAPNVLDRRRLA